MEAVVTTYSTRCKMIVMLQLYLKLLIVKQKKFSSLLLENRFSIEEVLLIFSTLLSL